MGKHFGNLQRLYGVTYFVLSPHELKPFAGMITPGLRNAGRRFLENGTPWLFGLAIVFSVIAAAKQANLKAHRKNPLNYACDE